MKFTILLIYILLSLTTYTYSQEMYRVYFQDKGNQVLEFQNELYNEILTTLDPKAIERRKINLKNDNILSNKDIPIYKNYLDSLSLFATIKSKLTWYNYIIAEIDSNNLKTVEELAFVNKVQLVIEHYINSDNIATFKNCGRFEYDKSFNHVNMLNIPELHRYGFTGEGVRIGFLDSGFDYITHKSLSHLTISKTYDFIFRDSIVYNEEVDISSQDHHGSIVLATVGAYDNSDYIGIAPNAEFYLAKTEDLRSETYYELDLFAEAIIWMENNGVDIINSSLGYRNLDTLPLDYEDLDGSYSIAARAVNDASEMGMICVISSGNNGDAPKTLGTPADADSSVAVGALEPDGVTLVAFSSNGPNSKGIMKPNLVAQGLSIFSIDPNSEDNYGMTAGTSLSSPLIAGCFGLLKSSYSNLDSYTLKSQLYKSADKFDNPDNRFGFGLPNMFKAISDFGVAISPVNQLENGEFIRLVFYIFPENKILSASLYIEYSDFNVKTYPLVKKGFDNQFYVDIPKSEFESDIANARCVVKSFDEDYFYPSEISLFEVYAEGNYIQCGVNQNEIIPEEILSPLNKFDVFPTIIEFNSNSNIAAIIDDNYNIDISISNIEGRNFLNESINFGPGVLNYNLTLNNLNSGVYFVTLSFGGKQYHKKIIIL